MSALPAATPPPAAAAATPAAKINYLALLGLSAESRFTRLYADYFERARDLVRRMYGLDLETAEDLAQAAFTDVWREVAYIDPARERSYVFRLAINQAISLLRQRRRRGPHSVFSQLEAQESGGAEGRYSGYLTDGADAQGSAGFFGRQVGGRVVPSVEEGVEYRDLLRQAIERCRGERQRNVVLLRLAGFKGGEIAEALNIPEATVRSDLHRHQARCGDLAALR